MTESSGRAGDGSAARVAVDGRSMVGNRSGIGVFTTSLVERWARAGKPVEVYVGAGAGADLPGLPVVEIPRPFHLRAAARARRTGVRYFSPDSLIVPTLLGRRATATVHDLAPVLHPHAQTVRVRLAYRLLLGAGTGRAGAVVVPSEATAADLRRISPRARLRVVPEGPRSLPAAAALPDGVRSPYLLSVGTLEPRKHPVELVEAFVEAAPADWQLVLAGGRGWLSGPEWSRLQRLARPPRVLLLGFVDDAVLRGLLDHADALAYPSAYEGFGLPVLEAMAAGVPVITTTTPALAELADDAAVLVDLDGPDPYGAGLRAAVSRLLGDGELRERLAEAGRRRAASFDWDVAAETVWSLVTEPR